MFYSYAFNTKSKKHRNFFKKYKTGGRKKSRKSMELSESQETWILVPVLPVINFKVTTSVT